MKMFCSCVFLVMVGAKGYYRNICYNEGFDYNSNFNNCAAERKLQQTT